MSEVQLPEGIDPAEVYKNWDSLPNTRTGLVPGEGMWAKQIAPGVIGLNNSPIHADYRWQDILVGRHVAHRRWKTQLFYRYEPMETEEEDIERRKLLLEKLKKDGRSLGFMFKGLGYVSFESDDFEACAEALLKDFAEFDFRVEPYGDDEK
jgi:hypothetical protein